MKCDIEVVGERCRRRNEPRVFYGFNMGVTARSSVEQRPGTPEDTPRTTSRGGKGKRTSSKAIPTSASSWRREVFHSREESANRGPTDDPVLISQGQSGVKVRISYVDYQGHVHPRPAGGRSRTTLEKGSDVLGQQGEGHGLNGWGSFVSISSLGRLYRPQTMMSTRDKILTSALDKHFVGNPQHCGAQLVADTSVVDDDLLNASCCVTTTMPSIPTTRPQLTTSIPSSSPPPPFSLPKTSSPDAGQPQDSARANNATITISDPNTPRSNPPAPDPYPTTSSPITRSVLNHGIHTDGPTVTTSVVMNGIRTNGAGPTSAVTMTRVQPDGKGPVTTTTTATLSASVNKSRGTTKALPAVLNGIHARGKGPTSSDVMNRLHLTRKGSLGSAASCTAANRESANTFSPAGRHLFHHHRSMTTAPGKRGVHFGFGVSAMMAAHLRSMYLNRRAQSAGGGAGGWQGPGGSVAMAYGRLRSRRKTVQPQPAEVERDETKEPPVSRMFRKFRMVCFLTVTLIRLKAAIVVNSLDRTERSAAEIQWRTLYGQQEAEKLAFTKSYYSRERITTKMPRWALEIFDIPPEEKTEHDCRRLHALFRGMRSFDKFTEEIQMNLCRSFSYTCVEETRIVLRRGHIGHNFYFIYSGSVFVNVPDTDCDGELFIKTEATLAHGDSFGELALLKDIRRTATVSVRETCELLVVDKDVFSQVCPRIFEKELMEKRNFISNLSLFYYKWWSADILNSLCMEAQIQEYKINKIVVENNTTEDWLYICMEGQCQVIRCLSEEGEEEEEEEERRNKSKRGREQSVILSEELIELLSSANAAVEARHEDADKESSKEKLLYSLGLEYIDTGKRSGAFLEEVEEEERRKALMASSGPMTLTSLMAQKEEEGKRGLVYIKVGNLQAEEVFDMGSLIRPPAPRTHSALLLVSCGARMLRVKKSLFLKLASQQAMDHTRALVSKHPFPTEEAIVESYQKKMSWNAFKVKTVKDVVRSKDMRSASPYRGGQGQHRPADAASAGQSDAVSQTSRKNMSLSRTSPRGIEKKTDTKDPVSSTSQDKKKKKKVGDGAPACSEHLPTNQSPSQSHVQRGPEATELNTTEGREDETGPSALDHNDAEGANESSTAVEAQERPLPPSSHIFPILEVEVEPEPETLGSPDSADSVCTQDLLRPAPLVPVWLQKEVGPAPEAVIVRRKSFIGSSCRPSVSVDTTFVTRHRRRNSRDGDTSSGHVTRFNLGNESGESVQVAEKA